MARIQVSPLSQEPFDVVMEGGSLRAVGNELAAMQSYDQVLVISDAQVASLYLPMVQDSLAEAGFKVSSIQLPTGNQARSTDCIVEVWSGMADCSLTERSAIVALGGSVVCDVAGFVASTYKQGIAVVYIPTTLHAMVQTSLAGRVSIDLETYRGVVAIASSPVKVLMDTDVLKTLPEPSWESGLTEVVKLSILDSEGFFFWLGHYAQRILSHDIVLILEVLDRCVKYQARRTPGEESELIFGEPLAQALINCPETTCTKAQALAQGMRFDVRLAAGLAGGQVSLLQELDDLLSISNLEHLSCTATVDDLLAEMKRSALCLTNDSATLIRFALPSGCGVVDERYIDEPTLRRYLEAWLKSL